LDKRSTWSRFSFRIDLAHGRCGKGHAHPFGGELVIQKVLGQQRNILRPLTQWRQVKSQHVEAKIQHPYEALFRG
jgi:hypothetical protein